MLLKEDSCHEAHLYADLCYAAFCKMWTLSGKHETCLDLQENDYSKSLFHKSKSLCLAVMIAFAV